MPSIRSFVAHLSRPELLGEFLSLHNLALSPEDLSAEASKIAVTVNSKIAEGKYGVRTELERDIDRINALSDMTGEVAIASASIYEHFAELPSRHARATWLFLNDRTGFRRAEEIQYGSSKRRSRDWTAFNIEGGHDALTDEATLRAFEQAFREQFDTPNVHIDIFDRFGPDLTTGERRNDGKPALVQFIIFREDRSNTENVFRDSKLTTENRRNVVEASITYERATGLVECVASKRDSRQQMVQLVGTVLLGCPPDVVPVPAAIYSLDELYERTDFPTEPVDGIVQVYVAMMRLEPRETTGEKITFEIAAENGRDIWSVLDARLGEGSLKTDFQITQVKIVVRYTDRESGKTRTLPIIVTPPHRSTLKEHLAVEQTLTSKYMSRWGLIGPLEAAAEDGSAEAA